MNLRLLPALVATAVLCLSACTTAPESRPEAAPVDTSIMPPQTALPSPDATTASPIGSVTAANLPAASDLQWNEAATWKVDQTSTGGGGEQVLACQQNSIESLGASAIAVRTFTLSDSGEGAAIAMSFDSHELADQAYATAGEWLIDCQQVLIAQGRTDGSRGIPLTAVDLPQGRAQMTEWSYRTDTTDPNNLQFESEGLIQVVDRVAMVMMRIEGQDNNWDLEPDGPTGAVHPMIRSLPAVADKLVD